MNKNSVTKLLAIAMELGITSSAYDNYYMFSDEKLMNYSISLIMEIDELLDKGYTKDEIATIIKESDFCTSDLELTREEGEYLRSYSNRMLDIRCKLYNEEKSTKEKQITKAKKRV